MENKNSTKHPSAYKIISIVVIVILAILFTFPLYWIITGSFLSLIHISFKPRQSDLATVSASHDDRHYLCGLCKP